MKSTRESYGEYLVSKGREDKDIVVFDADLAAATCTKLFKSEYFSINGFNFSLPNIET